MRFSVDPRRLKATTIPDKYPLPRMEDFSESLRDASVFTTLDSVWGYWQVPIRPDYRDRTTFMSHLATYRYSRMPVGPRNAPAKFQRGLEIIL